MPAEHIAVLFDIDGTLIITGGAGATSWRLAFDELYGIPADIGEFTDTGMTDPDVGRQTFEAVLHREPSRAEFTKLLERRLHCTTTCMPRWRSPRPTECLTVSRSCAQAHRAGLPTGTGDRQRRGRGPRQVAPSQAQPVLLLRGLRLGRHRPGRSDPHRPTPGRRRLRGAAEAG